MPCTCCTSTVRPIDTPAYCQHLQGNNAPLSRLPVRRNCMHPSIVNPKMPDPGCLTQPHAASLTLAHNAASLCGPRCDRQLQCLGCLLGWSRMRNHTSIAFASLTGVFFTPLNPLWFCSLIASKLLQSMSPHVKQGYFAPLDRPVKAGLHAKASCGNARPASGR